MRRSDRDDLGYMPGRQIFWPELGDYFKRLRESRGWNERSKAIDIAKRRKIRLSYGTLSWLETGRTLHPDQRDLRAIASLYGTPYREIAAEVIRHTYGLQVDKDEPVRGATIEDFEERPLLASPIAAGQPLVIEEDPEHDSTLAFRKRAIRYFTNSICMHIGRREESMLPRIEPGDVVLLDQNVERRKRPRSGHIYAVNFGPLTGDDGGAVKRIELSGNSLIVSSDNPDKSEYPTLAFPKKGLNFLDVLKGEVVWFGRYEGTGKKAARVR